MEKLCCRELTTHELFPPQSDESYRQVRERFQLGLSGLATTLVRLAPNWTNLGIFQIRKVPYLSHLGAKLTHFGAKLTYLFQPVVLCLPLYHSLFTFRSFHYLSPLLECSHFLVWNLLWKYRLNNKHSKVLKR